jgi:acetoin utilization deacetylase AcuC-like enzyme
MPTGFLLHPAASLHDTGWGHPEHQGRLPALASALEKDLLLLHEKVVPVASREATLEELSRVHPYSYLRQLEDLSARAATEGVLQFAGEETPYSGASWGAAVGSAGTLLAAVDEVAQGRLENAFVATRPPGHHASSDHAMGFCSINHVAVAARYLQVKGLAERVAILDWDVHHGNGTQNIFYEDPSVFYLSLHQSPFYPGTGHTQERGAGAGEGTTLNIPLPAGTEVKEYLASLQGAIATLRGSFRADFVLVSAGYDALAGDPLGGMMLEPEDFYPIMHEVMGWASEQCGGNVVACLEGGYHPKRTAAAAIHTIRALAGVEAPIPT